MVNHLDFRFREPALLFLLSALATSLSCSRHRDGEPVTSDGPTKPPAVEVGATTKEPPLDVCPVDNPYCKQDTTPPPPACATAPVDLTPTGVNVMVAVDGSASMLPHWSLVQAALKELRESHPDSAFGLHVFWGKLADAESGLAKSNWCGDTENHVLDVGDNSEKALLDFLGDAPPGPTYAGGLLTTSPVVDPLNFYLQNATKLADPKRTNYLVFITAGNDNCFGNVFSSKLLKHAAYEKLALELTKRNIRIIPVGFDASSSASDAGAVVSTTDIEVLQTLLDHGGSGLKEVPKADDPSTLSAVIAQVGQAVRNCRFAIPDALDPAKNLNPFALDLLIGGTKVTRDRHNTEGWNFVDGNTSQVEMFGQACQAVRAKAQVVAQKTCSDNVCGTASIKVETKPRAVLLSVDASASRISCEDGSMDCLMVPDSDARVGITYWEAVQHAVGESLVQPINDDVAFGLQLFPSKDAAAFSCDVDPTPEIAPASGTAISIMSQVLEKLPFGFSPVVQALEDVAAMPGVLADPKVQGAVVMLTDGGDNCAGVTQAELVTRLGAAAAKLLSSGVKTYVVRYGAADGSTPDQEAQLRAIVANGGTASSDPADLTKKPYVDAQTVDDLTAALSQISNGLATCAFTLGELSDDADKTAVNLYLNGEVVPFDKQAAQQSGWGWLDPEQTSIQLYGQSCDDFKNNHKTSVIVEFGCEQVIVL